MQGHPSFHRLAIADLTRETADAVSIAFAVPPELREAYRYVPGQYLTLEAPVGGEVLRRSYSICSGLDDAELRVAIRQVEGGRFSTFANTELRAGDTIDVMTPSGRFTHAPDPTAARTYAAFAAGSGITPILAIVKTVLAREPDSRFFLFYGNRTTASILFRTALEDLKDRFLNRLSVFQILSREQQDLPVLNGRLDPERVSLLLRTLLPADAIDTAFVCGPLTMIDGIAGALVSLGVPEERVLVERFTPAPGAPRAPAPAVIEAAPAAIAGIILDGVRTDIPVAEGETLIDAAVRAGLAVPWSCHGGMCCTCRARIVEGAVTMNQNYSLEKWEMAAGFVLTCQAHPTTDRVVVDYDAM